MNLNKWWKIEAIKFGKFMFKKKNLNMINLLQNNN